MRIFPNGDLGDPGHEPWDFSPSQGLHIYAQVAYLRGSVFENFPKGGLGGPGMGALGNFPHPGLPFYAQGAYLLVVCVSEFFLG